MSTKGAMLEAVSAIHASAETSTVETIAAIALSQCGFAGYKFSLLWPHGDRINLFTALAGGTLEDLFAVRQVVRACADDDLALRLYRGTAPFVWSSLEASGGRSRLADRCLSNGVSCAGSAPVSPTLHPLHASLCVFGDGPGAEGFKATFQARAPELRLLAGALFLHLQEHGDLGPAPTPTKAEGRVLELLSAGYRAREIGERLGKSERTVQNQIESLRHKLGARNAAEAVAIWMNGWITLPRRHEVVELC